MRSKMIQLHEEVEEVDVVGDIIIITTDNVEGGDATTTPAVAAITEIIIAMIEVVVEVVDEVVVDADITLIEEGLLATTQMMVGEEEDINCPGEPNLKGSKVDSTTTYKIIENISARACRKTRERSVITKKILRACSVGWL
jgi:hypothetical protein